MELLSIVLVALSGVFAMLIHKAWTVVWDGYVKPWLEAKGLYTAAMEIVRAVEAEFGRGGGETKKVVALARLGNLGYDITTQEVKDAVASAWFDMNIDQIMSDQKESPLDQLEGPTTEDKEE